MSCSFTLIIASLLLFLLLGSSFAIYKFFAKNNIAIIGAMDVEIQAVLNNLSSKKSFKQNDFEIITGNIGQNRIILSKSGIGKVNSATTTQFIIDKYKPQYIINIGIAGSLNNKLKTGDIIIADKMVQHDFDITAFNYPKGCINSEINSDKPTIFHSDEKLIENFKNKFESKKMGNISVGTIATGDIFVNKASQKKQIIREFNADAIDMECAAIAQTAQRNNIPVLVLRTISDSENDSTNEYKQNKKISADNSASAIITLLK